jgi:hypothetical protein
VNERTAHTHLTERAESHREVIRILACTGPCDQGRIPCPSPMACALPEGRYDRDGINLLYVAIACVLGVIFVSLLVAHTFARYFA